MDKNLQEAVNGLCAYLARRDIAALTPKAALFGAGLRSFDVLMVFGGDLTLAVEHAAAAYHAGMGKKLLVSGGIGHSTDILRANVKRKYGIDAKDMAEGDVLATVAMVYLGVPQKDILSENKSANCGPNAEFSLRLLQERNQPHKDILLLQDPFLQRRSHASLEKHMVGGRVFSFAPIIPTAEALRVGRPWSAARFIEFLEREIPRLRDDEAGYGPRGSGYIVHCEIPPDIEAAYALVMARRDELSFAGINNIYKGEIKK